tara:strand:+ start:189 stop:761 length:573 start_codon:yes stop_codon:yes gene_type:complete
MNLKSFKVAAAAIAMVGMVFTGCAGEDGDAGPAGPAGTAGVDGNANVSSSTFTVLSADWTGTGTKRDTLSVPGITQAVVNTGSVQVFQTSSQVSDSLVWAGLPFSYIIGLNTQNGTVAATITIQAEYNVGEVYLSVINSLGANITGSANFPGDRQFKVVVIPSSSKIEGVNLNNYEEVKAVYGIKEFDIN